MKKIFLGLVLSFITFECIAQEKLPTEKLIKDYDIFQSIFEKANAGLYKYHSKKEIDSSFLANRKRINNTTTYREFYNIIWNVIDYTGSSHNSLAYPNSLDKLLSKQKIFFPISLKHLNGKLYSISDSIQIPLGCEILSVNKINVEQFSKDVSKYISTDGHNLTGKYAFLETDWLPFYVYLAYGEQIDFSIEYKKNGILKTETLQAVDYKTAINNYKKRFVPTYEKGNQDKYSFKYINDKTGLINVNTFAMGGEKSEGHKKYASFLDSVFIDLKNKKIENIIVDIRQNGGGNDPNDLLLYSYLTKRSFRENKLAYTLFNSVPLKQYFVEEEKDEIQDLEKELKKEHSILKNGKYFQNDTFNKIWHPNPNAFQGRIYLLISPFVASAGSLFASMVKSDNNSVVVGQESLGGYYGHTGHIPVTYKLPNTELLITFSIVDLVQDVQKIPYQKHGDGVKPDYNIEPKINDYLNNKDVVLEFAKRLTEK